MRASARRRPSRARIFVRRAVALGLLGLVLLVVFGAAYAGSASRLADGTRVAGVDVGGRTLGAAAALLRQRFERVERTPVAFAAGDRVFRVAPVQLGVRVDWASAVRAAAEQTDGFAPVRGLRRLGTRLFGTEVSPQISYFGGAVEYKVRQIARAVDRRAVEPSLVRRGLGVELLPGRDGYRLDRAAARDVLLRALASSDRSARVALPVLVAPRAVTTADLRPALAQARTALRTPVRIVAGETRLKLPRWRIASLLRLPAVGSTRLEVAGPAAERWFEQLATQVDRAPVNAGFALSEGRVGVTPSASGVQLDVPATRRALETVLRRPTGRVLRPVTRPVEPERTTREARAMGVTGVVGSYTTTYGGEPGRVHNVQLVSTLIDGHLIAPGETFSFNATTGERNAERGFQEAPVVINGELRNGIGGGVCQVSTTVFNAAFEAGLPVAERRNHALYIDHYPLGRDATVNYPDLDLRFTNDTGAWLLLRTFVGAGSLTVNLYGTPQQRRVETVTAPLEVAGPVPEEETEDPELLEGKRIVDEVGVPPRRTSVRRIVRNASGTVLSDTTWSSYYVGEPSLVRVGTKPKPKPEPKPKPKAKEQPAPALPAGPVAPASATAPVTP